MPGGDELRVTLTPSEDDVYALDARGPRGSRATGFLRLPLGQGELERRVLAFARGLGGRDVGGAAPTVVDARRLGALLADSLLVGAVGTLYERARRRARRRNRRLRLTLSMGEAPVLLSLPWELLYRRTGYVASQRDTPLVRHLDVGEPADPPPIDRAVRVLGIVASPSDLTPLDVNAERELVERATRPMTDLGRVELDWLKPATPGALRRALRDCSYHVIHFVGHGGFDAAGDAVLILEHEEDRRSVPMNTAMLTTLLDGQHELRVVVLNSCQGARSTLADPFASTAAALIERGVPAVVAMQFEISDKAAIRFAFELFTHLFGRHDPIDVAVAEARMALYVEVDQVEWATPVLYLRDPDVELFQFLLPEIAAPIIAEATRQWITTNASDLTPHAAVTSAGRHSIARTRHLRRLLPYVAGGAAIAAVTAGVVLLRPRPDTADEPFVVAADGAHVQLAVAADGRSVVAWDQGRQVFERHQTGNGWSDIDELTTGFTQPSGLTDLLAAPDGTVCAFWHGFADGTLDSYGLYQRCRTGDRWTTAERVDQRGTDLTGITTTFAPGFAPDGTLHAAWETPPSTAGYADTVLSVPGIIGYVQFVIDSEGRLHVLWWNGETGEIDHRWSRDEGQTWSEPVAVHHNFVWHTAADGQGGVHLLSVSGGELHHFRWTANSGWNASLEVTGDDTNQLTYPGLVGLDNGGAAVAWVAGEQLVVTEIDPNRRPVVPVPVPTTAGARISEADLAADNDRLRVTWITDQGDIVHLALL